MWDNLMNSSWMACGEAREWVKVILIKYQTQIHGFRPSSLCPNHNSYFRVSCFEISFTRTREQIEKNSKAAQQELQNVWIKAKGLAILHSTSYPQCNGNIFTSNDQSSWNMTGFSKGIWGLLHIRSRRALGARRSCTRIAKPPTIAHIREANIYENALCSKLTWRKNSNRCGLSLQYLPIWYFCNSLENAW